LYTQRHFFNPNGAQVNFITLWNWKLTQVLPKCNSFELTITLKNIFKSNNLFFAAVSKFCLIFTWKHYQRYI
jgi:hypothetical protein